MEDTMPIEHRNERELLVKEGITLAVVDAYQTGFGNEVSMGKRYIVHNDERMIQSASLERAEVIMGEVLACPTLLTEEPD